MHGQGLGLFEAEEIHCWSAAERISDWVLHVLQDISCDSAQNFGTSLRKVHGLDSEATPGAVRQALAALCLKGRARARDGRYFEVWHPGLHLPEPLDEG